MAHFLVEREGSKMISFSLRKGHYSRCFAPFLSFKKNIYFRGAVCDLPMYRKYFRLRGKPPSLDIDDTFYINWFSQSKSANVIEFEGLKRGIMLKWYPSENSASIRDLDNREILITNSGLFGKRSWAEVNGPTQSRHDQDMIFTQATKIKHSNYTSFHIKEFPCFALKQKLFFSF